MFKYAVRLWDGQVNPIIVAYFRSMESAQVAAEALNDAAKFQPAQGDAA